MQISLKIIQSINHAKSTVCIKFQLLVTFSSLFTASSSLPVFPPSVLYKKKVFGSIVGRRPSGDQFRISVVVAVVVVVVVVVFAVVVPTVFVVVLRGYDLANVKGTRREKYQYKKGTTAVLTETVKKISLADKPTYTVTSTDVKPVESMDTA